MRLRSVSNWLRSKKRFFPKKNFELVFVASAPLSALTSTDFTPWKLSDLTVIVPVSRHADAPMTSAASDTADATRRTEGRNIRTHKLQRAYRDDLVDDGVQFSSEKHGEPG